ncbi:hypothetical protein T23_13780 [Turicibacter faecis]|uniref:Transposase n=2 Tax=Turicibacter faecis TaxID=2963365 RepID=A0ABM8INZ9_9FIRM|nr:hypothetical protein T23_13780 [Turicibacter sp. TC023]
MTLDELLKREFEKGVKQGLEQVRKQIDREIAKNLLDVLDDEQIAKATGVEIEEVRQLRHLTVND